MARQVNGVLLVPLVASHRPPSPLHILSPGLLRQELQGHLGGAQLAHGWLLLARQEAAGAPAEAVAQPHGETPRRSLTRGCLVEPGFLCLLGMVDIQGGGVGNMTLCHC